MALGKRLGPEIDYAESWEICDQGKDQSVVLAGPLAGRTLAQIVEGHGEELFGRHHPQSRFPLLFKFLDARLPLSVQVHPDDARAAAAGLSQPEGLGKTEAWVVLEAEPGSVLHAGLKRGVDRGAVERAVSDGTLETCLHSFMPRVGDCVFVPAGVPHAIGAGLLIAEIQQSSDTTYRLFDWNRLGADGVSRPLHIAQALEAIDFEHGPAEAEAPRATERPFVQRLVTCEKFVMDRWDFSQSETLMGQSKCHILAVLEGSLSIDNDPVATPASAGTTILIPADCDAVTLTAGGRTVLLDMYLP